MFKNGRRALLEDEVGKMCTGLWQAEQFWKMRSAKRTQDCSESSIATLKCLKLTGVGALLEDEVGKMCTGLWQEEQFWKMR